MPRQQHTGGISGRRPRWPGSPRRESTAVRGRRTAVAANEDKCTNAQKPSAQHSEIQRAASILIAALMRQAAAPLRVLEACQEDARFSHLKERFSHLKERFSHLKVTEKIRRALDDRKLAPTPKPLASTTAKLARFETKNAASAPKATSAPRSACDFRRGNGPLRGGFRGGGDRTGTRDPSTIRCNMCAQLGHGWLTKPQN